ncbi:hypothetical protein HWD99_17440 [Microbacterium sp. C5A9]|uniref:MarR family transcriptional regulator n=1 Tax=Microbacterium sp. C5A9 TaxID=2736663 RepID=UPI001F522DC4|nr:MarR family transcriptional regulator [Microbacterium sp. C5A9]MCI1020413.1 hypothetical protein [Microbacterium sp. C5A9]
MIDGVFGTRWAEIEEILAMIVLSSERVVTTRRLADASGLGRRAVSRLVLRLHADALVGTRRSADDARVIEVFLEEQGHARADELRSQVAELFRHSRSLAEEISRGLGVAMEGDAGAPSVDALDLLRRVCEAGAALVHHMPAAAMQGRLAARQRAGLVLIASTPGGVRLSMLASALEVTPAGGSYIADQLLAKGFVRRSRGVLASDRRAVLLEVTEDGSRAVAAVAEGIEIHSERLSALFSEIESFSR